MAMNNESEEEREQRLERGRRAVNKYRAKNADRIRARRHEAEKQMSEEEKQKRRDEQNKRRSEMNQDELRAKWRQHRAERRARLGNEFTVLQREVNIKTKFGLSKDEWNTIYDYQRGRCAGCLRYIDRDQTGTGKRFCTDHCYNSGCIRGLLCPQCNTALGHVKDSIWTLYRLIEYLQTCETLSSDRPHKHDRPFVPTKNKLIGGEYMGSTRAELLRKIAGSSVSSGGTNLRDGRGRIVIKKLSLDDGFKGARFTMDGVIVSSSKIPVTELTTGKALDINPNEPGTDVGWVQLLDEHESAFGSVKAFVLSLYGEESSEVDNEDFIETLEELTTKNSAHGMVLNYSTFRKVTRTNKVEIVLPKWEYVEQSEADIKAMKKWLDQLVAQQKAAS